MILNNCIYGQCDNNSLGNINNDDVLNILDIVGIVSFVLEYEEITEEIFELADINNDEIVDILDIIKVVQKVLYPIPGQVSILSVINTIESVNISWTLNNTPTFNNYRIYKALNVNDTPELILTIDDQSQVTIDIEGLYLYEEAWFWVSVFDGWDCSNQSNPYLVEHYEKTYTLDEFGNIIYSDMDTDDFISSANCIECHQEHVNEWSISGHGRNMHSELFFSLWEKEQINHPDVGERFCIQCHNPISFVTGVDLSTYNNPIELQQSNLPEVIKEGVTCTVCHSYTHLSSTYFADNSLSPSAEYHMYPGEGTFFGPIENPEDNEFHSSSFSEMYSRSEMCLPCHDFVIRDVEAEITFTEWNRIPGFAMSGGVPCQECHMPVKSDGTHDHQFVGVDVDLSYPLGTSPQHTKVAEMLTSAISIEYGAEEYVLHDTIISGEEVVIPITITSNTAHNIPSGTAFNRECWVECIVLHENDTLFSSGVVNSNYEYINTQDSQLLLFTSYLLNENGDTTYSITDTHDIINKTLPALGNRFHLYSFIMPNHISGTVDVNIRMLFRPFRPLLIEEETPEFLNNLPIFDMASISSQIEVVSQR